MLYDGLHLAQDGPKSDSKFVQDGHKFVSRGLLADSIVVIRPRFLSKKPEDDRRLFKILLRSGFMPLRWLKVASRRPQMAKKGLQMSADSFMSAFKIIKKPMEN